MNILIIYSVDHSIMTIKTIFFTTGRLIVLIMISESEYPPPPKKEELIDFEFKNKWSTNGVTFNLFNLRMLV